MAMASRIGFVSIGNKVGERLYNFEWFMGLSLSQNQKSIRSLHDAIKKTGITNVLEVSRKSEEEIGRRLSAFNLMLEVNGVKSSVEGYYHGSKVFNGNIKLEDCIKMNPKDSKKYVKDEIEKKNLKLIGFDFNGIQFDLTTKSLCYDYIYILALTQNEELSNEILKYDCFTDIAFNQAKSIACQARACALFKYLKNKDLVNMFIKKPKKFGYLYKNMYKYD